MSLDGFAWVGPGLGKPGWEDGYAIGETSQQTTGIKLTPQPYREKIGAWRSVQLRGFLCLARRSTTVAAIRRDVPPPCPVARRAGLGSPDKTACENFTCSRTVSRKSCKPLCRSNPAWAHPWENSFRHPMLRAESIQNSLKIDVVKESACASSVSRLHPSRDRRIRSAMIVRAIRIKKKIEMLQKTLSAKPLAKIRERAFEGAFLGVALIAMAGWAYFIILLSVKFFIWLVG